MSITFGFQIFAKDSVLNQNKVGVEGTCAPGFWFFEGECIDSDECKLVESCKDPYNCKNTEGGYECICPDGSQEDPLYGCPTCAPGYWFVDGECKDRDECQLVESCKDPSNCQNTQGGYYCICPDGSQEDPIDGCPPYVEGNCVPGFWFFDGECKDRDECQLIESCKDPYNCKNFPGGYECICPDGSLEDSWSGCPSVTGYEIKSDSAVLTIKVLILS